MLREYRTFDRRPLSLRLIAPYRDSSHPGQQSGSIGLAGATDIKNEECYLYASLIAQVWQYRKLTCDIRICTLYRDDIYFLHDFTLSKINHYGIM